MRGSTPITAVTVTYQSERTLRAALEAHKKCHDAGLSDLVVVDNASKDATRRILDEQNGEWITVVRSERNLGFGRGCNRGLQEVKAPYVLFINPDAAIEPADLRVLLSFMESNKACGIAGPAILGDDGEVQDAGGVPTPSTIVKAATPGGGAILGRTPITPGGKPFRTDWVSGAVLMARTDVLRSIGGFDPRFFLYFEETDVCRRVAIAGYEIWTVGEAVAKHVGGVSVEDDAKHPSGAGGTLRVGKCIAAHYYRSRYYYLWKHHGRLAAAATEAAEIAMLGLGAIIGRLRGRKTTAFETRMRSPMFRCPEKVEDDSGNRFGGSG